MSKLTEKEVTDTIAMLTLGIRLCNTTSKSDKKYSKGYIDNTLNKVLEVLVSNIELKYE